VLETVLSLGRYMGVPVPVLGGKEKEGRPHADGSLMIQCLQHSLSVSTGHSGATVFREHGSPTTQTCHWYHGYHWRMVWRRGKAQTDPHMEHTVANDDRSLARQDGGSEGHLCMVLLTLRREQ